MKAIIKKSGAKGGSLWVDAGNGVLRNKCCPFQQDGSPCGDWCPAFREPYKEDEALASSRVVLNLCLQAGVLYFDEIDDQRGKEK